MANDWIQLYKSRVNDKRTKWLARILDIPQVYAFGLISAYFVYGDDHIQGDDTLIDAWVLDDEVDFEGFTAAMADPRVGWLAPTDDGMYHPVDWDKKNSDASRTRANNNRAQAKRREKKRQEKAVTVKHDTPSSSTMTREDENREDEIKEEASPPCVSADPKPPREHTNDLALAVMAAVDAYNADQPEAKRLHLPSVDRVAELVQEKLLARGHPYSAVAGVDVRDVAMSVEGWREHTATIRAKDPRAASRGKLPKWGVGYLGPALDAKADRVKADQVKAAEREKSREAAEAKRAEQDAAKARRAEAEAAFADLNHTARKAMLDKYKRGAEPPYITIMRWYDAERETAKAG